VSRIILNTFTNLNTQPQCFCLQLTVNALVWSHTSYPLPHLLVLTTLNTFAHGTASSVFSPLHRCSCRHIQHFVSQPSSTAGIIHQLSGELQDTRDVLALRSCTRYWPTLQHTNEVRTTGFPRRERAWTCPSFQHKASLFIPISWDN